MSRDILPGRLNGLFVAPQWLDHKADHQTVENATPQGREKRSWCVLIKQPIACYVCSKLCCLPLLNNWSQFMFSPTLGASAASWCGLVLSKKANLLSSCILHRPGERPIPGVRSGFVSREAVWRRRAKRASRGAQSHSRGVSPLPHLLRQEDHPAGEMPWHYPGETLRGWAFGHYQDIDGVTHPHPGSRWRHGMGRQMDRHSYVSLAPASCLPGRVVLSPPGDQA